MRVAQFTADLRLHLSNRTRTLLLPGQNNLAEQLLRYLETTHRKVLSSRTRFEEVFICIGGHTMGNILIVDDQPCVRKLLAEELIFEGYEVSTTGDGKFIRAHLRSSPPDLVLLDLYLKGADGLEVLRDIKRQAPHVPVIIVTGCDSFQDDPRLSQADAYVIKSMDFTKLKQEVANALGRKQGLQGKLDTEEHCSQVSVARSF